MATVTISRVDGPDATFDPKKTLRVRPGTRPLAGGAAPATEVDIDGPALIIHSNDAIDAILALLQPDATLAHLTAPSGTAVWVNAKMVTNIGSSNSDDPDKANTSFLIGHLHQAVQEPQDVVRRVIQATAG